MKTYRKLSFLILAIFLLEGCATDNKTGESETIVTADQPPSLKQGGLYLLRHKDSSYYVAKVLVLDDFAAHLRIYQDTFRTIPTDISSENLQILIGHTPLEKKGFLLEQPELLKVEEVKETELEGYRIYLESMEN